MIIEYKLEASKSGMTVPAWVKDGGYYRDPDDFTMVGWTPNPPREFKVPDTVISMSLDSLLERVLDIHTRYPAYKIDDNRNSVVMSNAEVEAQVTAWYNQKEGL